MPAKAIGPAVERRERMKSDDHWGFLLALFAAVSGLIGLWIALLRRQRSWEATLGRVARTLGGTIAPSDVFGLQSLQFLAEGRSASLEFDGGEFPSTRVKIALFRRSPGVFRLLRQEVANWQALFVSTKDVKIGDERFDAAWFVTARPESLAHRIFAEDRRQEVIASVRRIARMTKPSIEITRDTLVVKVEKCLTQEEDILALALTATDFVRYLLHLGPEEGIQWVAADNAEPGLCPVCAASLAEGIVHCDKCRTPQHRECWLYVGQCSTYACKGKRFVA